MQKGRGSFRAAFSGRSFRICTADQKKCLKQAVLDNVVPNEREPLMKLLEKKAAEMGLERQK